MIRCHPRHSHITSHWKNAAVILVVLAYFLWNFRVVVGVSDVLASIHLLRRNFVDCNSICSHDVAWWLSNLADSIHVLANQAAFPDPLGRPIFLLLSVRVVLWEIGLVWVPAELLIRHPVWIDVFSFNQDPLIMRQLLQMAPWAIAVLNYLTSDELLCRYALTFVIVLRIFQWFPSSQVWTDKTPIVIIYRMFYVLVLKVGIVINWHIVFVKIPSISERIQRRFLKLVHRCWLAVAMVLRTIRIDLRTLIWSLKQSCWTSIDVCLSS